MRHRSSQFVFLLLLICSLQVGDSYAMNLAANAVFGNVGAAQRETTRIPRSNATPHPERTLCNPASLSLDSASRAAHRTPWPMAQPALQATATASNTGLLRA